MGLAAVMTGVLLVVAGPPFDVPGAAWIGFAPLLATLRAARCGEAAALGALAGGVAWSGITYGIARYHPALFPLTGLLAAGIVAAFALGAAGMVRAPWLVVRVLGPPALWMALEWAAASPLANVPVAAGVLLVGSPALSLASIVGGQGLSFLLVLSSAALVEAVARARRARGLLPRAGLLMLGLTPAALAVAFGIALRPHSAQGTVRYRAIQPAIPYDVATSSWIVPGRRAEIRERFAEEMRAAAASDAALVLWPEGAAMVSDLRPAHVASWVPELLAGDRTYVVSNTDVAPDGTLRNRAFVFDGGPAPVVYQKQRLVPLAEHQYEEGRDARVIATRAARVGPLICFESCFPEPARRLVAADADVLVVSTNDGPFGDSPLPLWHRMTVALRAAETGRPAIFVSNRGPSAQLDAAGTIVAELPLGAQGVLTGTFAPARGATPYVRWGYLLPIAAVAFALSSLVLARRAPTPAHRASRRAGGVDARADARPFHGGARAWWTSWPIALASGSAAAALVAAAGLLLLAQRRGGVDAARGVAEPTPTALGAEFLQKGRNTCGPAALAYVTSFLGDPVSEDDIVRRVVLREDGTTMLDLREAGRSLGYAVTGERRNYAALVDTRLPVIAHLKNVHYVVVLRAELDHVDLFDPASGFVRVPRALFERAWSGYVLTVQPMEADAPTGPTAVHATASSGAHQEEGL